MQNRPRFVIASGLVAALVPGIASSQYSKDPAASLVIAGGDADQIGARIRTTPAGDTYVSWYDREPSGSAGYDLRLQRLDPQGTPRWSTQTPSGVLVAERGFTQTQPHGLDVDAADNALLAFRDDRPTGVQITAAKIDPTGTPVWGAAGVVLTDTSEFLTKPCIAATTDGAIVVGWSQNTTTHLARLDAGGVLLGTLTLAPATAAGSLTLSALHAAAADTRDGAVIVSWIQQDDGYVSPRRLFAQKFNASLEPLWGPDGIALMASGGLAFGDFPDFVADADGGGVFAWATNATPQCFVQRVRADGSSAFPPGGATAADFAPHVRSNPRLAFDPEIDACYLFWQERDPLQSGFGIRGQRFDAAGGKLWSTTGTVVEPLTPGTLAGLVTAPTGATTHGVSVAWARTQFFGDAQVSAQRLDVAGNPLHPVATIASTPSFKAGFAAQRGAFGDLQLVWHDDHSGTNDVVAQNALEQGGVGPAAGVLTRSAPANFDAYTLVGLPQSGAAVTAQLDVAGAPLGGLFGSFGAASVDFGYAVLLIDPLDPAGEVLDLPLQPGPIAQWTIPIPSVPALCGRPLFTQGARIGLGGELQLSNTQDLYIGS